jgi:hypothetical protein
MAGHHSLSQTDVLLRLSNINLIFSVHCADLKQMFNYTDKCCKLWVLSQLLYWLYPIMRGGILFWKRGKSRWKDRQFLLTRTSHRIEAVSLVEMKTVVRRIAFRSSRVQTRHGNHCCPDVHQNIRQHFSEFRPMLMCRISLNIFHVQ